MDKKNTEQEVIVTSADSAVTEDSANKDNSHERSSEVVTTEITGTGRSGCSEKSEPRSQMEKKDPRKCKKRRSFKKKSKPVTMDDIFDTFTLEEANSYPDVASYTQEVRENQARLCISHMATIVAMPKDRSQRTQIHRAQHIYHYLLVVRLMIRKLEANDLSLKTLALKNFLNEHIFKCINETSEDLRLLAAECILEMFRKFGYSYFRQIKPQLVILIKHKMIKKEVVRCVCPKPCKGGQCQIIISQAATINDLRLIVHYNCLFEIVKELQCDFMNEVDEIILMVLFASWSYRHAKVREIGFNIAEEMIKTGMIRDAVYHYRFVAYMLQGLSDSVSAVRMASGKALRNLCLRLKPEDKDVYFSLVLPVLCISRYYVGDTKFMLFSQSTWQEVVGDRGVSYVTRYFSDIVSYYLNALKTVTTNIELRVTACNALAELVNKIEWSTLEKYMKNIVRAFQDPITGDEYHLSDACMLALAACIVKYPQVVLPSVELILSNLLENLAHPVPPVRKAASSVLAHIFKVYGTEYARRIVYPIYRGLYRIPSMPPTYRKGETKRTFTNEDTVELKIWERFSIGTPDAHLDMLGFPESVEPWRILDGAIFLIGDLATLDATSKFIAPLLSSVMQACSYRKYKRHAIVLDSLCQVIPLLAKAMKSQEFKEYLEDFFENIFYLIDMKIDLSPIGTECLQFLATHFGRNIIRGRVAAFNPKYLDHYDAMFH